MLELIAHEGPSESGLLSEQLWPGMPERWGRERLCGLRSQLSRRLGFRAVERTERGWVLSGELEVQAREPVAFGPMKDPLLEELRIAGPRGVAADQLSARLGISSPTLRQKIRRLKLQGGGEVVSGGGGYRLIQGPG